MGHFKGTRRTDRSGASSKFDRDHKPAKFSREKPTFRSDRRESSFRDDRSERRDSVESSKATCYKCGKPFTLPFIPTGDKPVYCRNCFKKPNERNRGEYSPRERERDMPQSADPMDEINAKLDRIMRALNIK